MPASPLRSRFALIGAALTTAAAVGAAWTADARRREERTDRLHRVLVDLLLNALSADDAITARHSRRVANLTDTLGESLGFDRHRRATLRVAALLHDMGKIDDRFFHIVHSREPLTPEERVEIRNHPHLSAHILKPLEPVHPGLVDIVSSHHESWNGSGYPCGAAAEEIPLEARIIAVADVFDALTQPRSYREPLSPEEVLERLEKGAGQQFDPGLVERVQSPEVRARWEQIAREGRAAEERAQAESPPGG